MGTNRSVYNFNESVDKAVGRDVAKCYLDNVPHAVRTGIHNFFDNLGYLNTILNDHLQGRFAQGWRNTERMAVNTTVGILGVRDVATKWDLPRQSNDFGTTLGKWGFERGPYLVLPILGPSSCRDAPGLIVSRVTNPMFWLDAPLEVTIPMDATDIVDQRARLQPQIDLRDRTAIDPYTFTRDAYLQHREAKVAGSAAPAAGAEDIYGDAPASEPASAPATQPSAPATAGRQR